MHDVRRFMDELTDIHGGDVRRVPASAIARVGARSSSVAIKPAAPALAREVRAIDRTAAVKLEIAALTTSYTHRGA